MVLTVPDKAPSSVSQWNVFLRPNRRQKNPGSYTTALCFYKSLTIHLLLARKSINYPATGRTLLPCWRQSMQARNQRKLIGSMGRLRLFAQRWLCLHRRRILGSRRRFPFHVVRQKCKFSDSSVNEKCQIEFHCHQQRQELSTHVVVEHRVIDSRFHWLYVRIICRWVMYIDI